MKSRNWDSSSNPRFVCSLKIVAIAFVISLVHSTLAEAVGPQEQFGWPSNTKTSSDIKPTTQQLPPELTRVRYPLPARTSPAELSSREQSLTEQHPPTGNELAPSGINGSAQQPDAGSTSTSPDSQSDQPYRLTSRFHLEEGTRRGYLILQVDLAPGAYIHSLTQGNDLNPSRVKATASAEYKTIGEFLADRNPTIIEKDPVFEQRLEKHLESVQFFVPLELSEGVVAEGLQPTLMFEGQVCTDDGICIPLRKQIVPARFGGYFHRSAQQKSDVNK